MNSEKYLGGRQPSTGIEIGATKPNNVFKRNRKEENIWTIVVGW